MYFKVTFIFFILNQQDHGILGDGTCPEIPVDICPYEVSEHTGELVKLVPKYLPRDHPEYDVRTPEGARDKINLYCAHPACYSQPCHNGGTCMEELDGYSCSCGGVYIGTRCEHHVCYSQPCRNGGTCREQPYGYSCSCRGGYIGRHCEYHACHSQPCLNQGTCIEEMNGHYKCSCPGVYRGSRCEQHENCPDYWVYGETKCFLIANRRSEWGQAHEYCLNHNAVTTRNGSQIEPSLLFIESDREYKFLKPLLIVHWTWMNCNASNGTWVCFTDREGTTSNYKNWAVDQPDHNHGTCAVINKYNGKMHNYGCASLFDTVCQVNI